MKGIFKAIKKNELSNAQFAALVVSIPVLTIIIVAVINSITK